MPSYILQIENGGRRPVHNEPIPRVGEHVEIENDQYHVTKIRHVIWEDQNLCSYSRAIVEIKKI